MTADSAALFEKLVRQRRDVRYFRTDPLDDGDLDEVDQAAISAVITDAVALLD